MYSQTHLNKAARQLNERPRKTLKYETPARNLTPVLHRPVEPAGDTRTLAVQSVSAVVNSLGSVWRALALRRARQAFLFGSFLFQYAQVLGFPHP